VTTDYSYSTVAACYIYNRPELQLRGKILLGAKQAVVSCNTTSILNVLLQHKWCSYLHYRCQVPATEHVSRAEDGAKRAEIGWSGAEWTFQKMLELERSVEWDWETKEQQWSAEQAKSAAHT